MKTLQSPLCFVAIFAASSVIAVNNLREEFTWTRIDYDWGNPRRGREVQERYGYSQGSQNQQEELYFPDSTPGYNSGSGFRPSGTNGRKPTLKPYHKQNHANGQQNQGGNYGQSQGSSGVQSSSQTRENYIYREYFHLLLIEFIYSHD